MNYWQREAIFRGFVGGLAFFAILIACASLYASSRIAAECLVPIKQSNQPAADNRYI